MANITNRAESIAEYGNLTSLNNGTLGVSYNGTNFVFQIDIKKPITNIRNFKAQYDLQSEETNTLTTIEEIEAKIGAVNFKNGELAKAKLAKTKADEKATSKENSIATFGNLTSETIEVDYGTDYTFQINGKTVITGLAELNTELNNQGDTTEDYTIDTLTLTFDETKTVAKAKSKANSIATFGNLTSETIEVDYGTDYTFQINGKTVITGLAELNTELNNQGDTTEDYTIDTLTLTFDETKTVAKAKSKANSIATFGNLTSETIEVDYGTDYTFQINGKTVITGLAELNTELNNQGDTTEDYTIDTLTLTFDETKTVAKAKSKANSIATFGNLTSETIEVDYGTDYTFQINGKTVITGLAELNTELNNQGDTTEDYTIDTLTLTFDETKTVAKAKSKANSIATFGNLTSETIEVDYGTDYTFQINGKTVITGLAELNTELNNQGDTTEDYTIDTLTLTFDETKTVAKAKSKANSIATFGNLTSETIEVDYGTDYTFQINGKTVITGLAELNTELNNQGDTTEDYTIDTLTLTFDETKTVAKAKSKANSIATFGNLTSETIEVDYGTDYTFQINGKTVITGLAELNTELNNQGDTTEDYTIDTLTLTFDETKTVAKAKSKANSIATFGNLTSETIEVDYGTDYTFQINGKTVITGLAELNTELNNQGDTTEDYTIDTLTLTFDETKTVAKAKSKANSIATFGNLTSETIEVDYGTDYTFQINGKTVITGLAELNTELNNQGDTTEDYTIDTLTLTFDETKTVAKAKSKANSIATFGNLTSETIEVDYGTDYTFQINGKTVITGLAELNTELNNQGDTTEDDYTIDTLTLTFDETKTVAKAKSKANSIATFGNLTSETIEVDYGTDYTFQINGKTVITGLAELNTELNNQGDTTEDDYTIDTLTLTFDETKTVAKAKSKANSIATFGNLTSETIEVDYGTDYTFQINGKTVITGLAELNTELNNQGDTTEDDYTIDTLTLTFDETKTVAKAKSKANSIATFGNLTSETIEVDYGTDYTFQINGKTVITGLAELNTELNNQGDTTEDDYTIDTLTLTFDETKTVAKAKSKANSIATFGNLTSETIEVDYGTDYTFQINGKTVITGLAELNTELNNQGDTTEDYTIDTLTLTFDETKTVAKAKSKANSIATFGNLTSETIEVDYGTDYTFQINGKTVITGLAELNTELNNQGDTTEDYTIDTLTLTFDETKTVAKAKSKANSIATFGNLTSETIEVDYGTDYTFQINGKTVITGLAELNTELNNQGDTTEDYTIDTLTLTFDETKTVAKAKSKANSIATFGNLTSETIEVDYGTDYTFQINGKTVITGLAELNTELNNQGDTTEDYTIDTLTLTFDETKTVAKAKSKANSIATFGNLTSETIEVDYGTDYTFQINGKTVITGLAELNTELNNQGDTTEDYTIDTLTLTFDETKTVAKAKSKANSIATFGNLTSETIEVDYGTDYTFQINGKTVITGLAELNTELNNQGDTTEDYTIDTLTLTFDETKTVAKAKSKADKATTSTTGEPGHLQDSDSNNLSIILPIVSGVILAIIVIGVLLKKYFKNKKNN